MFSQPDVPDETITAHEGGIFIAEIIEEDVSVFAVVVERNILNKTFDNVMDAVVYLFAIVWVFNLKYPIESSLLWEFLEKFVLQIDGGNLSMRLLHLKLKFSL